MAFYCDFVFIDVQNNSNRISAIEFPGRAGYKKKYLSLFIPSSNNNKSSGTIKDDQ